MRASIAWIGANAQAGAGSPVPPGRWGDPAALTLPLSDRGLLLADGLFETVLLEEGRLQLLAHHLARWSRSAALLGMAPPPDQRLIQPLVAEAMALSGIRTGALRLNWSRGSAGRGLDLPDPDDQPPAHRFWLQLSATAPRFDAVTTWISRQERRNAASLLSGCKSFAYTAQVQARREAQAAGADDALLLSSSGELCCGSAANLLVRHNGGWATPPLASGCLPGVMRGRALSLGLVCERPLAPRALEDCEAAVLINSLGCRPIQRCDGRPLPAISPGQSEQFWRGLLEQHTP